MHVAYCKQINITSLYCFAIDFLSSLIQFSILIVIIILIEFGIGIYAMNNNGKEAIDGYVIKSMTKIVKSYNGKSDKGAVDWVQSHVKFKIIDKNWHAMNLIRFFFHFQFKCCGVHGPNDYPLHMQQSLPLSCCVHRPFITGCSIHTSFHPGCKSQFVHFLKEHVITAAVLAIIFGIFQVGFLFLEKFEIISFPINNAIFFLFADCWLCILVCFVHQTQ